MLRFSVVFSLLIGEFFRAIRSMSSLVNMGLYVRRQVLTQSRLVTSHREGEDQTEVEGLVLKTST